MNDQSHLIGDERLLGRELRRRINAVNILYGLGDTGCHGARVELKPVDTEPRADEDHFLVSMDLETGELSVEPGESE